MSTILSKDNNTIEEFQDIIYPIEQNTFQSDFLEQKELLIQRDSPTYYKHLFSIENVDEILDRHRPSGNSLRVVKNQEPLPKHKYENHDGSLNLNQLYASYSDGYTIVVNEIERFWKPLRQLCQNMQNTFSHKTVANLYLTPANQKALKPHYDTHDVFVIQIHGEKHWKLYDADYPTPILNSHQPIFQSEQLRNERNIKVAAGDMLYIPRGVPHEAITTDQSSIHLTIGVYPTQWMDVISKAVQQLAYANVELRKALPLGFLNSKENAVAFRDELQSKMKVLLEQITDQASIDGALQFISEEFRDSQKPMGDGHFAHLDKLDTITSETRLKHRKGLSSKVQVVGNAARIIFPGNVIKGPAQISSCLSYISENKTGFTVGDIPLLSDEMKIKLSKRLIRGGLLKIADPIS